MKNVHIVTVGFDPHPSLEMLASGDVDYVYLLNDRSEKEARQSEKYITDILESIGSIDFEVVEIDCYDYQDVYDKIIRIADRESESKTGCKIHINFSRGTAIAVGAACTAACSIRDVDLYYSKWKSGNNDIASSRIIHVDVSEFTAIFQLKGATRVFFKLFEKSQSGSMPNSELMRLTGLKRNSLTNHTSKLCELNLIRREPVGKCVTWQLTDSGKKVLKRIV